MDYTNKKVKIINLTGWDRDAFNHYKELSNYIGKTGIVKHDSNMGGCEDCYRLEIDYDDEDMNTLDKINGRLCLRVENIEFLDDTYVHVKQTKPPLGVIPKNIYELQRVQDLCRALYEYSTYVEVDYELMIKWSDELNDRLYGLKGDLE